MKKNKEESNLNTSLTVAYIAIGIFVAYILNQLVVM